MLNVASNDLRGSRDTFDVMKIANGGRFSGIPDEDTRSLRVSTYPKSRIRSCLIHERGKYRGRQTAISAYTPVVHKRGWRANEQRPRMKTVTSSERRDVLRQNTNLAALAVSPDVHDQVHRTVICTVIDLSGGGAKVTVDDADNVPKQLWLLIYGHESMYE
jgi:hypothetical protein